MTGGTVERKESAGRAGEGGIRSAAEDEEPDSPAGDGDEGVARQGSMFSSSRWFESGTFEAGADGDGNCSHSSVAYFSRYQSITP